MKRAIAGLLMALALILGSHPGRAGASDPVPEERDTRRAVIKDCEFVGRVKALSRSDDPLLKSSEETLIATIEELDTISFDGPSVSVEEMKSIDQKDVTVQLNQAAWQAGFRVGTTRRFRTHGLFRDGRPILKERPAGDDRPRIPRLAFGQGHRLIDKMPFQSVRELSEAVMPSVVRIEVFGQATSGTGTNTDLGEVSNTGTGFVIDGRGYILTNMHVCSPPRGEWKKAPEIHVEFSSVEAGNQFTKAILVGTDPPSDLAVLKVRPDDAAHPLRGSDLRTEGGLLRSLEFADEHAVGEDVVALGFAHELPGAPTVSRGIISALFRSSGEDGRFGGLIQTDAAVNEGNSGGPLLNMFGEVVGVNTLLLQTRSPRIQGDDGRDRPPGQVQGISFARSYATAAEFSARLIREGRIRRASLGITTIAFSQVRGKSAFPYFGVKIEAFLDGSPTRAAGLELGDVITGIESDGNAFPLLSGGELNNALAFIRPGALVFLGYYHFEPDVIRAFDKGEFIPYDQVYSLMKANKPKRACLRAN